MFVTVCPGLMQTMSENTTVTSEDTDLKQSGIELAVNGMFSCI